MSCKLHNPDKDDDLIGAEELNLDVPCTCTGPEMGRRWGRRAGKYNADKQLDILAGDICRQINPDKPYIMPDLLLRAWQLVSNLSIINQDELEGVEIYLNILEAKSIMGKANGCP